MHSYMYCRKGSVDGEGDFSGKPVGCFSTQQAQRASQFIFMTTQARLTLLRKKKNNRLGNSPQSRPSFVLNVFFNFIVVVSEGLDLRARGFGVGRMSVLPTFSSGRGNFLRHTIQVRLGGLLIGGLGGIPSFTLLGPVYAESPF